MREFRLLAQPLWVNLLVLLRLILHFAWRNRGIQISERPLLSGNLRRLSVPWKVRLRQGQVGFTDRRVTLTNQ